MLLSEKIYLIIDMQKKMQEMKDRKQFTKKNLCDVCVPVRDQLGLSDQDTIRIANGNASLSEIMDLIQTRSIDTDKALMTCEALNHCFVKKDCEGCPNRGSDQDQISCMQQIGSDAIEVIEGLILDNHRLKSELKNLEQE